MMHNSTYYTTFAERLTHISTENFGALELLGFVTSGKTTYGNIFIDNIEGYRSIIFDNICIIFEYLPRQG